MKTDDFRSTSRFSSAAVALFLSFSPSAHAQGPAGYVPQIIPVQGLLTDLDGAAVEGEHDVTIALYRVAAGGTAILNELHPNVTFDAGAFTVYAGDESDSALDFAELTDVPELWLSVSVDGDLLTPRFRIGAVPYAGVAQLCGEAQLLQGREAADFALADHDHAFGDLSSIPADFADGNDADTLGGLSCVSGVAKYSGSSWTCAPIAANEIVGGTLSTGVYSAYADLQSESRLGMGSDTNLLTLGAADTRYMSALISPAYHSLSAADEQTTTLSLSGRFCALAGVSLTGQGNCSLTGTGPFTLTATAADTENTTCRAICF